MEQRHKKAMIKTVLFIVPDVSWMWTFSSTCENSTKCSRICLPFAMPWRRYIVKEFSRPEILLNWLHLPLFAWRLDLCQSPSCGKCCSHLDFDNVIPPHNRIWSNWRRTHGHMYRLCIEYTSRFDRRTQRILTLLLDVIRSKAHAIPLFAWRGRRRFAYCLFSSLQVYGIPPYSIVHNVAYANVTSSFQQEFDHPQRVVLSGDREGCTLYIAGCIRIRTAIE